jgi:hypothetical protein
MMLSVSCARGAMTRSGIDQEPLLSACNILS